MNKKKYEKRSQKRDIKVAGEKKKKSLYNIIIL